MTKRQALFLHAWESTRGVSPSLRADTVRRAHPRAPERFVARVVAFAAKVDERCAQQWADSWTEWAVENAN